MTLALVASVEIDLFLSQGDKLILIDVRSPSEFEKGHIKDAVNLPLFSDEERAAVGLIYKQQGASRAFNTGLEIVGPKLSNFVSEAQFFAPNKKVAVYCWRGGLRSQSMGTLLQAAGFEVTLLKGGYKAYRQLLGTFLNKPLPIQILTGPTGSGKTEVLNALQSLGHQVVDLENLANHRGSAFGGMESLSQPSTETFQNAIFEKIWQFDLNKPIWIEDESISLGSCYLPNELFNQMKSAFRWELKIPHNNRLVNILNDYGDIPEDQLINSVNRIERRMGPEKARLTIEHIKKNEKVQAAELLLGYYDKAYSNSRKRGNGEILEIYDSGNDAHQIALQLIKLHDENARL